VILRMVRRAWATFALFFAALTGLAVLHQRRLARMETYLASAGYAFFFVLLPYLAAYMHFYVAYAVATAVVGGLLQVYLTRVLPESGGAQVALVIVALLVVPTLAVVLERHTGIIYALEILAGLALLMLMSVRPAVRAAVARLETSLRNGGEEEQVHV
jgi:inner membrane protein involved in colicin E2 resistance